MWIQTEHYIRTYVNTYVCTLRKGKEIYVYKKDNGQIAPNNIETFFNKNDTCSQ